MSEDREEAWYWVRVRPHDEAEPALWMPWLQEWKISGGAYDTTELAEIGPRIVVPPEMARRNDDPVEEVLPTP